MCDAQILMIEDDFEDVALVKAYLADKNLNFSASIEHRDTLAGGLECLNSFRCFDVVLLDLGLGDGQGLNTFLEVYSAYPHVPMIVLSGNSDERIALKALKLGAQDYLVKGRFDSDILGRSIRYAIERQEQRLELECKTKALEKLSHELEQANLKLERLAATDGLTKIHNRRYFDETFLQEWHRLAREGQPLSVIMCDVDYFKVYNDTYGHSVGDACLKKIANALTKTVKRPADVVARYGGEEFVVALPGTDLEGAVCVAESIRDAIKSLNLSHATSPISSQVTMSLGVASQIPEEDLTPVQLLEAADHALYQAKEKGRDRVAHAYSETYSKQALKSQHALQWVARLREALDRDLFELYAQPIQPITSNSSEPQFEILLRLCDIPNDICMPALFLPIAEQYDFLGRIDVWVIERLFYFLEKKQQNHTTQPKFYINLSNSTCCNAGFADFVFQKLQTHHLCPEQFCFEVPESVATSHLEPTSLLTQSLRAMNCQVALDDFGSGMTSFNHLKKIPVDYVKIDGLFVRDISTDSVAKAIVESIHHISKLMNLETIAEFVESRSTLEALHTMGVDYAQGHYFCSAKPLSCFF